VVEPGATSRDIQLPAGAIWRNGWTGERVEGGQTVTEPAPLDRPPYFHREG